ncbi:MAG: ABC transporter permease subunit, partial [Bacteroidales bacterium]|nr:ABC transporter permease subunit [Bacteroidales bacterium]
MKFKFIEEKIFRFLMITATLLVFAFVISIVCTIIMRGWSALSWDLVSKTGSSGLYTSKGGGGFLSAIVGSLYIVGASTCLGLLISIPVVFYLNVYLKKRSKMAYIARIAYDVLFGIPSIVYGAFGLTIMVYFGLKGSLGSGIIVVTLLIIPIFIRSMDEVTRQFPRDILDATYALGATRFETIGVVLRQISPGIATATLLSTGRAIGDAASVMLTAGYTDNIPSRLSQPVSSLPMLIFNLYNQPAKEAQDRGYAAALALTLIVLALSLAGRFITSRFSKNKLQ